MIFVVIAGIPPSLIKSPPTDKSEIDAYFDIILGDARMQNTLTRVEDSVNPSCQLLDASGAIANSGAYPPRRLVEAARGFGKNAVLGSICNEGFGTETGLIMRAVAERLRQGVTP